ncbi:hypothetical protein GF322_01860 [Candidatus Dependentiae bacterium]|nr:hypothetical protein [Candidatus Dependentiae bacterium]
MVVQNNFYVFLFLLLFSCKFINSATVKNNSKNICKAKVDNLKTDLKDKQKTSKPKKETVDKIVAKVNGVCILQSDLETPKIVKNGGFFTLQEAINEELFLQKSSERHLFPTQADVDKQVSAFKIQNGLAEMPDDVFEEELIREGFSLNEYKNQLARMLAVEKLKHAEFSERVVVTSQEVEQYYKKNPVRIQEKYLLKICDIDNDLVDENKTPPKLLTANNILKKEDKFKWEELGWIEKSALTSKLHVVSEMDIGQISDPIKINDKYQLVKLEDKKGERLLTLKERYSEIEQFLHENKKNKFEKDFEGELRKKALIVYLK